jgi:hypothetical protein
MPGACGLALLVLLWLAPGVTMAGSTASDPMSVAVITSSGKDPTPPAEPTVQAETRSVTSLPNTGAMPRGETGPLAVVSMLAGGLLAVAGFVARHRPKP